MNKIIQAVTEQDTSALQDILQKNKRTAKLLPLLSDTQFLSALVKATGAHAQLALRKNSKTPTWEFLLFNVQLSEELQAIVDNPATLLIVQMAAVIGATIGATVSTKD